MGEMDVNSEVKGADSLEISSWRDDASSVPHR